MAMLQVKIELPRRSFALRLALELSGAETVVLLGPSGAGKSSLLRAVAGLERPARGRISFGAQTWFGPGGGWMRPEQRNVGYLPQDYALFPHLDVAGNVRFGGGGDELLKRFGIAHLAAARPAELSGGERQRAALARALARRPGLLLLDEPFAALDGVTRARVRGELADLLAELALPALVVTHTWEDAAALADRIGVLHEGRLLALDSPGVLLDTPADATVARICGANVLGGMARPGGLVELDGGGVLPCPPGHCGRVEVAIQPWELRLQSEGSGLLEEVRSVELQGDSAWVRSARLRFRVPGEQLHLLEGARSVNLTADRVRVY